MSADSQSAQVKQWVAGGVLDRGNVLEALFREIKDYEAVAEPEQDHLRDFVFQRVAITDDTGTRRLTAPALTSQLQHEGSLPSSPAGDEAGSIIFQSLAYLSSTPFPTPSSHIAAAGLTSEEVVRGLAWLLPGRSERFVEAGNFNRARTVADHRRLIFQSLATSRGGAKLPFDFAKSRKLAEDQSTEFRSDDPGFADLAVPAFDADGDEMFHDVVEVLFTIRPDKTRATVHRDAFREHAKTLHAGAGLRLHDLSIPRDRFKSLLKVLLPMQLADSAWASDEVAQYLHDSDLESAADCVTNAFCQNPETGITWPMFNSAAKKVTPYLFEPLYRLLSRVLLGASDDFLDAPDTAPPPSQSMTFSRLGQLGSVLLPTIFWDVSRLLYRHTAVEIPDAAMLMHALATVDRSGLLIVSGTAKDGDNYVLAAFVAKPGAEQAAIIEPLESFWDGTALMQLGPTQDVFRGVPGQPAWTVASGGETRFGNAGSGAAMALSKSLKGCVFTHDARSGGVDAVYRSGNREDSWTVELDVSSIELWGEMP